MYYLFCMTLYFHSQRVVCWGYKKSYWRLPKALCWCCGGWQSVMCDFMQ